MFRTVPLSIIRSFSLYTQQWYMSYGFADSLRAGSGSVWTGVENLAPPEFDPLTVQSVASRYTD